MNIITVKYDNTSVENITCLINQLNLQLQQIQNKPEGKKMFIPKVELLHVLNHYITNSIVFTPGKNIKFSKLLKHFNFMTDLTETHISFSRLMDLYISETHAPINKKRHNGSVYYCGISFKNR